MFRQLSKITLKYTGSLFSHDDHPDFTITPKLIESWLKDIQTGLDALLDDQMIRAETIFSSSSTPFHAFGHGLLIYTQAMLSMERSKIEQAIDCLSHVEILLKRILSTCVRKKRPLLPKTTIHASFSAPNLNQLTMDTILDIQFELIYANCILMSATLQFCKDHWIDHLKAAYELRKAYKIYERLFQSVTGMSLNEYNDQTPILSSFLPETQDLLDETVESGAYFGIGLFHLLFSLLPVKVKKILNGLGFHASRRTAIHLLRKSYESTTMYSSLSALILLTFHTYTSVYLYSHINHIFSHQEASQLFSQMQSHYPQGSLWTFFEAHFNPHYSISLLEQLKNANHGFEKAIVETSSITELPQFRALTLYALGWSYLLAGHYHQASETFFALVSISTWSRLFYHYMATCCMMMVDPTHTKSILEIRQMVTLLDSEKKVSVHDQFAETRIRQWLGSSLSLQENLKSSIPPLWELIYLWNATVNISSSLRQAIQSHSAHDPLLFLLQGVIARDQQEIELAQSLFHQALNYESSPWIPYAMYEIAVTNILLKPGELLKSTIINWVQSIENYYQSSLDTEWDTRMQLKCQLLIESCDCILK